ncbi:MAG: bifunctional pyr operon transcriptional regulator/uracil phosphoribosyltransferase PyrR [Actinomycetota bacterium]
MPPHLESGAALSFDRADALGPRRPNYAVIVHTLVLPAPDPVAPGNKERSWTVLDDLDVKRALVRIAHEIVEHNRGSGELVLVGIHRRGVPLAERIGRRIAEIEGSSLPVGALDVSFYRDDVDLRRPQQVRATELPFDVTDKTVVLVDDVLFTGRTVRAAIDALVDFGRPRLVRLAVLVDRGHRELPIRADFIGKNIPTSRAQQVRVHVKETDGKDSVVVFDPREGRGS